MVATSINTSPRLNRGQHSYAFIHPIFDTRLSLTARALLLLMSLHPYRHSFGISELHSNGKALTDSEAEVRHAVKELLMYDYVRAKRGLFHVPVDVLELMNAASLDAVEGE